MKTFYIVELLDTYGHEGSRWYFQSRNEAEAELLAIETKAVEDGKPVRYSRRGDRLLVGGEKPVSYKIMEAS